MSPTLRNDILNKWASGYSGGEIAKALKLPRNRVSLIVTEARRQGDFRAVHHKDSRGEIIGLYRHRPPEAQNDG